MTETERQRGVIKMTDQLQNEIWEPGQKANPGKRCNGNQVKEEREELDCETQQLVIC